MRVNGLNYHIRIVGNGEPLVLLHGFTGSGASWDHLVLGLSGHFRVITIDLPGHGGTDAPESPMRYAMPKVTADLLAIARACGAETPHLLGYSMGGRLALHYALHHPVKSLILESASPGLADPVERAARAAADDALADRIEREGIAAFVAEWERLPLFASQANAPDALLTAQRAIRLANTPGGLANSLRGMGTGVQPALWDKLAALDAPVLLLAGALDGKFTAIAREMAKRLRTARVDVIPEAGHSIHLEQPIAWRDAVLRFIRDSARRRLT